MADLPVKHIWTKEDTYAGLAQKYYGRFDEPFWRLIYEHNRAIIGDHPNAIRVGQEIEIPSLPDALKSPEQLKEAEDKVNLHGAKPT